MDRHGVLYQEQDLLGEQDHVEVEQGETFFCSLKAQQTKDSISEEIDLNCQPRANLAGGYETTQDLCDPPNYVQVGLKEQSANDD